MARTLTVIAVEGVPAIRPGDPLGDLLAEAATRQGTGLEARDVLVVTQKVVSKAEGRLVPLAPDDARGRQRLIEAESVRVLRRRGELSITETPQGFVCANAGVDVSNVDDGTAALLPLDGDRSARRVRDAVRAGAGVDVAVVVSDTFGRAWRTGLTDVAIGVSGVAALLDLKGHRDANGRELRATEVAVADEIACAAELVMGKASLVPAAIVRGIDPTWLRESSVRELVRAPGDDLFR